MRTMGFVTLICVSPSDKTLRCSAMSPPCVYIGQFSADGLTLVVGETWSARATRWNATTGAFIGIAGTLFYAVSALQCGVGLGAGIVAAEQVADRYGG